MLPHGGQGLIPLTPQGSRIQSTGSTEGREELTGLFLWPIATGAHLEHLNESEGKEGIGLEATLLAEKVKFHKKLIHQPPIQRTDHMGKGSMESSLAVGNSEEGAHSALMIRRLRP
jgi:hypothetical protein